MPDDRLTVAQAAKMLCVTRPRIIQMIDDANMFPHAKKIPVPGTRYAIWWLDPAEVEAAKDRASVGCPLGLDRKTGKVKQYTIQDLAALIEKLKRAQSDKAKNRLRRLIELARAQIRKEQTK